MNTSKVEFIKKYIYKEIREGKIKKGQRLPSCRQVSLQLSVNKITVNRAYSELEKENKVYSIPRGGYYLIESEERENIVQEDIDFSTILPDNKLIPYREFNHVMNKAVDVYKNSLFNYESKGGLFNLRETLSSHFRNDGVYTTVENIIITNGAQQAINLVFQSLFKDRKGKLLVEAPTYDLALKMAEHLGIEMVAIERRKLGFNFKELELIFKTNKIKAFYIIPRHHNPTGYILAENDKKKIVELAKKYNVFIIEDDYLADLGSKKGAMPIHYYDVNNLTIYIRSFSKAFMPGIRIGALVVPNTIKEAIINLKYICDLNTSKIPQAALDLYIRAGMYEKHTKKVKKAYEEKMKKAIEIFKGFDLNNIYWNIPEQGIFIWLELPHGLSSSVINERLKSYGILIKEGADFFLEKDLGGDKFIRLCISGVPHSKIEAITTILKIIKGEQLRGRT